ncbi:unnamed protein product [Trifolium pratense]|uniref:Uncharacterized protein n=1 Tax=Trifolium pratense TaxID=57577 RepID=A0ACB0LS98_TRIPR|nr:unnamed protein product [Trifolium pratense]
MPSSMLAKITCLVVICFVIGIPLANADLSCGQVVSSISTCFEYIRNPASSVPTTCCNGIRSLNDQAKTITDRRSIY